VAIYNVYENLTPVLLTANAYLFYVSFAGLGIGRGLGTAGIGLVLSSYGWSIDYKYNTDFMRQTTLHGWAKNGPQTHRHNSVKS